MPDVDAQRVCLQLERILASAAFADAERARRFLRYVVEGREAEIKESVVAVEPLGRTRHWIRKPTIVRVEAGRLLDRLGAYYEAQGGADPILILLPKGRSVPEFMERRPQDASRGAGVLRLHITAGKHPVGILRCLSGWPQARLHRFPKRTDEALGSRAGLTGGKTSIRIRLCILAVLVAGQLIDRFLSRRIS